MATTAANSSRKASTNPGAILFESPQCPRARVLGSYGPSVLPLEAYSFADSRPLRLVRLQRQPSGTANTIFAGPSGALGIRGESAADLFDPCTLTLFSNRALDDHRAPNLFT
ncbi:MAG: hypothetical protein JXA30_07390 [Deltaproteobacteria bacterium]|nr:hypothetical protein [Deltaproteobacteria bacterium]